MMRVDDGTQRDQAGVHLQYCEITFCDTTKCEKGSDRRLLTAVSKILLWTPAKSFSRSISNAPALAFVIVKALHRISVVLFLLQSVHAIPWFASLK